MPTTIRHRKSLRHYDEPGQAHELTFSCYHGLPVLTSSTCCQLLSQSIDRAAAKHGFELIAFVYMPEHVHLIVFPIAPTAAVARLLYAIKRPVSTRIKQHLIRTDAQLVKHLTIRERPGKTTFRFWQEGAGYDRNIASIKILRTAIEYVHNNPVRRGLCQTPGQWK
ncbi:MAG: transposase [Phycisphaerales bacterium]|nr:MAG: transposase [Phycisphaerales bacterium]